MGCRCSTSVKDTVLTWFYLGYLCLFGRRSIGIRQGRVREQARVAAAALRQTRGEGVCTTWGAYLRATVVETAFHGKVMFSNVCKKKVFVL